jgi:hypothetical protein
MSGGGGNFGRWYQNQNAAAAAASSSLLFPTAAASISSRNSTTFPYLGGRSTSFTNSAAAETLDSPDKLMMVRSEKKSVCFRKSAHGTFSAALMGNKTI